jgi:hypothetical protein
LRKVQKRRMLPTQLTQALQVFIQDRVISTVLQMTAQPKVPFAVKLLNRFPVLRRIPARVIGMGFRPEHVETSEARAVPAEKPQMAA